MPHPPQAPLSRFTGVVMSAGKCSQTVKVRIMRRTWDRHLRKNYFLPETHLADDYYTACVPGDVVRIVLGGARTSRTKRHVVDEIVSPMRTGTERKQPEGIVSWLKRRGRWDYLENKMMGGAGKEWKQIRKIAAAETALRGDGVEVDPKEVQERLQKQGVDPKSVLEELQKKLAGAEATKEVKDAQAA